MKNSSIYEGLKPPFIPTIEDSIRSKTKKLFTPYLNAENEFADSHLLNPLYENIKKEMFSFIPKLEESHVSYEDKFVYYWKRSMDDQYKTFFRCKKEIYEALVKSHGFNPSIPPENEELLLDGNLEAKDKKFFDLGWIDISPDEKYISYGIDYSGDEIYELFVKYIGLNSNPEEYQIVDQYKIEPNREKNDDTNDNNSEDGEDESESGEDEEDGEDESDINSKDEQDKKYLNHGIGSEFEWMENNTSYLYLTLDDTLRSYRVYIHNLGESHDEDKLLFEELDDKFSVSISKSTSNDKIFITTSSTNSCESSWIDSHNPDMDPICIIPRQPNIEYYVEHMKETQEFLILTNEGEKKNFTIIACPESAPALSGSVIREIIPHQKEIYMEEFCAFKDFIAISNRKDSTLFCSIYDKKSGKTHSVDFPEDTFEFHFSEDNKYESTILRLMYSSPIRPLTVYDYNIETKQMIEVKVYNVVGFNPSEYSVKRLNVLSRDGISEIPLTFIYKKDENNQPLSYQARPTFLTAYGAYGISEDCYFRLHILPLLNRGILYAIAHVRGGGEKGREWWENGMLLNKKNTFYDFVDIAKYLIQNGYSQRETLCCYGASAGGLTIGASINIAPELFKAAILDVPFVNVLNTMKNPDIPLTTLEYLEWGNPNDKEYEDYISSYSPIDNIQSLVDSELIPDLLILSGLNDPRVSYVEPTAYCCKLRESFASKNKNAFILLKTNMKAGHSGASGQFEKLEEWAYVWVFVIQEIL